MVLDVHYNGHIVLIKENRKLIQHCDTPTIIDVAQSFARIPVSVLHRNCDHLAMSVSK
jgi:cysteine sulfinate desulfinase/cysteine desulfurase-like protein